MDEETGKLHWVDREKLVPCIPPTCLPPKQDNFSQITGINENNVYNVDDVVEYVCLPNYAFNMSKLGGEDVPAKIRSKCITNADYYGAAKWHPFDIQCIRMLISATFLDFGSGKVKNS